jgi:hypothetical protein
LIVVVGIPGAPRAKGGDPGGLAAAIALAAGRSGASVELVGRVSDDATGDSIVLGLGRAGVGHAALLRDPAATTHRIEPADLDLALRYIAAFNVLVLAELDASDLVSVAAAAVQFGGGHLVALVASGSEAPDGLPEDATVLTVPASDPDAAFAGLVAAYAVALDAGRDPGAAWQHATRSRGADQLSG